MLYIMLYDIIELLDVVTNDVFFTNRFKLLKVIKNTTNKLCAQVYCNKINRECFLKVRYGKIITEHYDILIANSNEYVEKIYEIHTNDAMTFIISEFITGKSLAELGIIDNIMLLKKIINQTFDGLKFIHNLCIIHCDIKLDNIMLTTDGTIKIVDFDLSKICRSLYITDKCIFGSDDYIAPESFDLKIYSKKSDIWSFGISLFKLISGKFPYLFKPNKNCYVYSRNYFRLLDIQIKDQQIKQLIAHMLDFVDDNRPEHIKLIS